jgi:hypothetical protein
MPLQMQLTNKRGGKDALRETILQAVLRKCLFGNALTFLSATCPAAFFAALCV